MCLYFLCGSVVVQKVRFLKIWFLFVSPYGTQFHRATTLRRPREDQENAPMQKMSIINIDYFSFAQFKKKLYLCSRKS